MGLKYFGPHQWVMVFLEDLDSCGEADVGQHETGFYGKSWGQDQALSRGLGQGFQPVGLAQGPDPEMAWA